MKIDFENIGRAIERVGNENAEDDVVDTKDDDDKRDEVVGLDVGLSY